ncbi:hypothetical protein AB834_07575 [PVC group bacterium (ex Bugula neritina AB1)]|nr:hypothetical protein AB834_07575 [PVC group bacterium (ex Bugula neritina AB1)]
MGLIKDRIFLLNHVSLLFPEIVFAEFFRSIFFRRGIFLFKSSLLFESLVSLNVFSLIVFLFSKTCRHISLRRVPLNIVAFFFVNSNKKGMRIFFNVPFL